MKTRYDGNHSLDTLVTDKISSYFDFQPVCPEQMIGLPTPRKTLRLVRQGSDYRMVDRKGDDYTDKMTEFSEEYIRNEVGPDIVGAILKGKSPSCGVGTTKIYNEKGQVLANGSGLFAHALLKGNNSIPMIDSGKLKSGPTRDRFYTSLFQYAQLCELDLNSKKEIIRFHQENKYLLMEYCPQNLKEMGQIVANINSENINQSMDLYKSLIVKSFNKPLVIGRRVNTLMHIFGYFKKHISKIEKNEILLLINDYKNGLIDISSIQVLFNYLAKKYSVLYISGQKYFERYPKKLLI